MHTLDSPFQLMLTWAAPLMFIVGYFIILVACIVGATHPVLRKEFIFLALGTFFRCLGGAVPLISNMMLRSSSYDSSPSRTLTLSYASTALAMLSMLFYMVGFILLALRVRALPAVRR